MPRRRRLEQERRHRQRDLRASLAQRRNLDREAAHEPIGARRPLLDLIKPARPVESDKLLGVPLPGRLPC